jgi:hypothetical protein
MISINGAEGGTVVVLQTVTDADKNEHCYFVEDIITIVMLGNDTQDYLTLVNAKFELNGKG